MPGLQKMIITPYKYNGNSAVEDKDNAFTVMVNPASYQHDRTVRYNSVQGQGAAGASPTFNKVGRETITFELVFDATGGIPMSDAVAKQAARAGVAKQIADFKNAVVKYDGDKHKPPFVKICWASLVFRGVLDNLSVTYSLFRPTGVPLRARARTTFSSYTPPKELKKQAKNSSPDLSHMVEVKAGDTLPLLCWRIYGDSRFYPQVAKVNGLSGFREVTPGTRLLFPPLGGTGK